MVFRYFAESDMLYIELMPGISTESQEVAPGVVLDFDAQDRVIGIEIEDASAVMDLSEFRIAIDPGVVLGKPAIKDMRLTVEHVLNLLASGLSPQEIVERYPGVSEEDVRACLRFAAQALQKSHESRGMTAEKAKFLAAIARVGDVEPSDEADRWVVPERRSVEAMMAEPRETYEAKSPD